MNYYPRGYCTLFNNLIKLQEAFSEPEPCQSCSTKFGKVLNVSMLSPEVLTTMHILLMRHSGIQKEIFDLLVTTIWCTKTPASAKLFSNSEEDLMGDTKDPFMDKFVITAT